jgi:hypothetical protein
MVITSLNFMDFSYNIKENAVLGNSMIFVKSNTSCLLENQYNAGVNSQ